MLDSLLLFSRALHREKKKKIAITIDGPEVDTGGIIKLIYTIDYIIYAYTKLALSDSCCTFETEVVEKNSTAVKLRIIRSAIKR